MKTKIFIITTNKDLGPFIRYSAQEAEACAREIFGFMKHKAGLLGKNDSLQKGFGSEWKIKNGVGKAHVVTGAIYGEISITDCEIQIPNRFEVETSKGTISVQESADLKYPGIYIDLVQTDDKGDKIEKSLVEVECLEDKDDKNVGKFVTYVWGSSKYEDATTKVIHNTDADEFSGLPSPTTTFDFNE